MPELTLLPRLASATLPPARLFINGSWADGAGAPLSHYHPASGEELFEVPCADRTQVDAAIAAARNAFDSGPWPRLPGKERAAYLHRIADLLRADQDNLHALLSLDNATPSSFVGFYNISVEYSADIFDSYAGWIDKVSGETFPRWDSTQPFMFTTHEPVGVTGIITPWNAPISLLIQKLAPALASGCTVVTKPSELAPLTSLRIGQLIAEADLPPGVFNLVMGPGATVGQALVDNPAVDKISFTGSRAVGGRIAATMGSRVGRVSLELGGKTPALIFSDADIPSAIGFAAGNAFMGMSGQVCVCQSRILVQQDVFDEVLEGLIGFTSFVKFGDPFDPSVSAAPMISPSHRAKVFDHIERAVHDGAKIASGGGIPDGAPAHGNFVAPTILVNVTNDMAVAQDEIFGPVICVLPFDGESEAVRLANDTEYGLGAAVYTRDLGRALRLSNQLRAGNIGVNTWAMAPHVPFGGMKQSGVGRENGKAGIMEYLETKSVFIA